MTATDLSDIIKNLSPAPIFQELAESDPVIYSWLARVKAAVDNMKTAKVVFVTSISGRDVHTQLFIDHNNQPIDSFQFPLMNMLDGTYNMDEEVLPWYRIRFADGAELLADDSELRGDSPELDELIKAVSGAFACARDLGYDSPWSLAGDGSDKEKSDFSAAYENFILSE